MAEIADLTYNVVAFSEIMQMIWKRTNDHGKNWRHVYKALLLLEYLIKTGTEKVAQQCKENIYAIQTLKDFQYIEEGKDQGMHVREKAKQLVSLLKDDERLKNERARALKAKERFARTASGFGSDGSIDGPTTRDARVRMALIHMAFLISISVLILCFYYCSLRIGVKENQPADQCRKLNSSGRRRWERKNCSYS